MGDLLPCPFCGGRGSLWRDAEDAWVTGCNRTGCASFPYVRTREAAVAAWNRRAPATEPPTGTAMRYTQYLDAEGRVLREETVPGHGETEPPQEVRDAVGSIKRPWPKKPLWNLLFEALNPSRPPSEANTGAALWSTEAINHVKKAFCIALTQCRYGGVWVDEWLEELRDEIDDRSPPRAIVEHERGRHGG